ncbi:MAG: MBL fold metallo-hydrolase [Oscillospiraceae bacterium]|nr:MBL fold metallo-hydrolase [Oscillospiraceae bacterium]
MIFDTIPVGQIDTNCYLIGDETEGVCALVDPGGSAERVLRMVERSGLRLEKLLLTHGHWDHVDGIPAILEAFPGLPVYIHEEDLCPAGSADHHYKMLHKGENQRTYGEGDTVRVGSLEVRVLHTPGHSPGSVTLLAEEYMLSGDTLFAMSCGRTDLPGGDSYDMIASLVKLADLEGNYKVCPGHGEDSTLDFERKNNPYMKHALSI